MALSNNPDFFAEVVKLSALDNETLEFFSVAEAHFTSLGLTLKLGTLADAVEAQKQHGWPVHAPMVNPQLSPISEDASFAIIGLDESGVPRCSQSARAYSTGDGTLAGLIESHRFYYGEQFDGEYPPQGYQTARLFGEALTLADRIKGEVLYSGGIRIGDGYTGKGLNQLMLRVVHTYGELIYNSDWIIGQTRVEVDPKVIEACGYDRMYPGFDTYKPELGALISWSLVAMKVEEHYRDIDQYTKKAKARRSGS